MSPTAALAPMTPRQQLRAGRLPERLGRLGAGLVLYGWSMALLIRSELGLDPWDVFHEGLTDRTGWSFGTVIVLVGAVVLLAWIPLRQAPGLGTVANIVVVAAATDAGLAVLDTPDTLAVRAGFLVGGIVLNGLAGGLYIGSQLGSGPRDGLMTGLAHRTGRSIRSVRTAIEVAVLVTGFALGGTVGLGTALYAVSIGPLVQWFLRHLTVDLTPAPPRAAAPVDEPARPASCEHAWTTVSRHRTSQGPIGYVRCVRCRTWRIERTMASSPVPVPISRTLPSTPSADVLTAASTPADAPC